ncbi:hypothetical protein SCP_0200500 [Sparassis crispa]|uniref:Uncharacterized protein n=1 Tax=Sparassis crispa TaxID=139825 RepID=A0A401G9P4_9APHY|nr:hypothetical protein SCP_0200500 [Sparassis crispa]GBE78853.1 hypothetical protein SCP_0200500 [Sparassis crispa]
MFNYLKMPESKPPFDLVQSLHLCESSETSENTISLAFQVLFELNGFTRLEVLHIQNASTAASFPAVSLSTVASLASVHTLVLTDCQFNTFMSFALLVGALPQLRHLSASNV